MITSAFLQALASLVTLVVSPLPTGGFGSMSTGIPSWVLAGSGWLGFMNMEMPISEMVSALGMVVQYWLPAVIVYKTVNWVYRHIPMVGGG